MQVILNTDVSKVGRKHELVTVAAGYARNYLIPRGLAAYATEGALADLERRRAEHETRQKEVEERIRSQVDAVVKNGVTLEAPANEKGHLFAAVHREDAAQAIAEALGEESISADRVALEKEIKDVGTYQAELTVGEESFSIPVTVEGREPDAKQTTEKPAQSQAEKEVEESK